MNISIVIPCYNEEKNIQTGALDKIAHYLAHDTQIIEVIIVDDGSTDQSVELIKRDYLVDYPKFKLINGSHGGKSSAVTLGVKEAIGDYILFTDFDLATPIEQIRLLSMACQNGAEIAIGSRGTVRRGAPLIRKIMAIGMIKIRKFIIGLDIKDTQCGFKMFKRDVFLQITPLLRVYSGTSGKSGPSVSAGWDVEMLFIADKKGYKIAEIPVEWLHVDTKRVNFLVDSFEALYGMLQIRYNDFRKLY